MSADQKTPVPDDANSDPTSPSPMPAPSIPPTPDDARARPDALRRPATGGSAGGGNIMQKLSPSEGKMLPPTGTVEVPKMPRSPTVDTPDEAAKYGDPKQDTGRDSNWADNTKPKPDAKNARSSLL